MTICYARTSNVQPERIVSFMIGQTYYLNLACKIQVMKALEERVLQTLQKKTVR